MLYASTGHGRVASPSEEVCEHTWTDTPWGFLCWGSLVLQNVPHTGPRSTW